MSPQFVGLMEMPYDKAPWLPLVLAHLGYSEGQLQEKVVLMRISNNLKQLEDQQKCGSCLSQAIPGCHRKLWSWASILCSAIKTSNFNRNPLT